MIERLFDYAKINEKDIERKRVNNIIDKNLKFNKVLYVYGSLGIGKTKSVMSYSKNYLEHYVWYECEEQDNINGIEKELISVLNTDIRRKKVIIFDEFNRIYERNILEEISYYIENSRDNCKFIFISSKKIPKEFINIMIKNQIGIVSKKDLLFKKEEIELLFKKNNINTFKEEHIKIILELTGGVPILVILGMMYFKLNDNTLDYKKFVESKYYKEAFDKYIWDKLSKKRKEQLIIISLFPEVTLEQAKFITKDENIEELLKEIVFLKKDKKYIFKELFKSSIKEKYDYIDREKFTLAYIEMGKCYEKNNQFIEAAYSYSKAKLEKDEVRALEKFCDQANFLENFTLIKEYLIKVSKELMEKNSSICGFIAMFEIIHYNFEEGRQWIKKLEYLRKEVLTKYNRSKNKEQYFNKLKVIEDRLILLYAMLQENNSIYVKEIWEDKIKRGNINDDHIVNVVPTANFPSILKGMNDTSSWWIKYDKDNVKSNAILKYIYHNNYYSAVNIALSEIDYEKNNIIEAALKLSDNTAFYKESCNLEFIFVSKILTLKIQIASGNINDANMILNSLKEEVERCKDCNISNNLNAAYTRYNLLIGNIEEAKTWLINYNKQTEKKFLSINMYEYFTKARVLIAMQDYTRVIAFLEILYKLNKKAKHNMNMAECLILQSIALNRLEEELAFNKIEEALKITEPYDFIRIYADEGDGVYEVINKYIKYDKRDESIDLEYIKLILTESRKFARMYPKYLSKKIYSEDEKIKLTKSEKEIINLISNGMSNSEISEYLNIKIDTVKFHTKNIYSKLNVKNRTMAISVAKEFKII